MQKLHQSPEFLVIRQNEANAKFFVASPYQTNNGSSASSTNIDNMVYDPSKGGNANNPSTYDDGGQLW